MCCGVLLWLVVLFCLVLFVLCWLVWGADGKEKRLVKTSSETWFWKPKMSKKLPKIDLGGLLGCFWALLGAKMAR